MSIPEDLQSSMDDINSILDEEGYGCRVSMDEANGLYRPLLEDTRQRFITYLYFPWGTEQDIKPVLTGFYWGAMLPKMRGRRTR